MIDMAMGIEKHRYNEVVVSDEVSKLCLLVLVIASGIHYDGFFGIIVDDISIFLKRVENK